MKRKLLSAVVLIAAVTFISGAGILFSNATADNQDGLLVTTGYLRDNFTPQVIAELRNEITQAEQTLSQRFDAQLAALEARLGEGTGGGGVQPQSPADTFRVITLNRGQRLTASVGTEIMLRIGTATGFGTAPALVDYTNGVTLAAGSSLTANRMYLVTIEGNGIESTADLVRVLVRGEFTVS